MILILNKLLNKLKIQILIFVIFKKLNNNKQTKIFKQLNKITKVNMKLKNILKIKKINLFLNNKIMINKQNKINYNLINKIKIILKKILINLNNLNFYDCILL